MKQSAVVVFTLLILAGPVGLRHRAWYDFKNPPGLKLFL